MKYIVSVVLLCLQFSLTAQKWNPISYPSFDAEKDAMNEKLVHASSAQPLTLDIQQLLEDQQISTRDGKTMMTLPFPDGSMHEFALEPYSVMQPQLEKKYSFIKVLKGYSTADKRIKARVDYSKYGFHAVITTPKAKYYIDPLYDKDATHYISYDISTSDHSDKEMIRQCGVDHEIRAPRENHLQLRGGDNIPLRTYRVAISTTGEFGRRFGDVESTMAYIVATVNKLNEIFENELSVRMILVDRNDELISLDPDQDLFTDTSNGGAMLSINTVVINNIIGADAYDIGHVFNTSCNVGGIASLSSMCSGIKGNAVTCLASNNLNYYVNVTAHEMGHQMSAQHTFNLCNGNNESSGNGYEPGSGTTIMSYSGLCGSQNVETGIGDNYYHNASLTQIYDHLRGVYPNCGEKIDVGNLEPTAEVSSLFDKKLAIPIRTPFVLEGSGSDMNEEDELTYVWEQMNLGPQSPLGSPIGTAPRFRSVPPSTKSYRLFPRAGNIFSNTGSKTEVIPDLAMEFVFHFTVRDNHDVAGTAVWKEVTFETVEYTEEEGKFEVTSFNGGTTYAPGQKETFTWNVSNTAGSKINTQFMDLYYLTSTSGLDFSELTPLASRIPNNGSFDVYLPSTITNKGKFILRAHDNIYFAANQFNIRVAEPETPTLVVDAAPYIQQVCTPQDASVTLSTVGFQGIEGDVEFKVTSELPEGITVTFSPETVAVGEETTMDIDLSGYDGSQMLEIEFESFIPGVDTFTRAIVLDIKNNDHSAIDAISPAKNEIGVSSNVNFSWAPSANAASYDFQLATSPKFGSEDIVFESNDITTAAFTSPDLLSDNTVYYWRVKGKTDCEDSPYGEIYAFSTEATDCSSYQPKPEDLPVYITQSAAVTVRSEIEIEEGGNVSKINIPLVEVAHDRTKDLRISLVAPDGTKAVLVDRICIQKNVKCGFNDDSNTKVQCPLNNSKQYRPKEPLSVFQGVAKEGTWVLEVEDTQVGNSGQIDNFKLDLCGSVQLNSPYLVHNIKLELPTGDVQAIKGNQLRVADDDNSDAELVYTLTAVPTLGYLDLDGNKLAVGDEVTQEQINQHRFIYSALEQEGNTSFSFTVKDNTGGFLGITTYEIDINDDFPSEVEDEALDVVSVYPNPAQNIIYVDADELNVVQIELYGYDGRLYKTAYPTSETFPIEVREFPTGNYFIKLITDKGITTKKVTIIR